MRILRWAVLLAAAAAGCAGGHGASSVPNASANSKVSAEAQAADLARVLQELAKPKSDYRITAADLLDVSVYGDPDFVRKVRVGQNGVVQIPLVGPIKLGGLTILEADMLLNEKLKYFYVAPQVSLFIEDYGNKQVFVLGEVNKPGAYQIPPEAHMTVLEAISSAGGFTPIAGVDGTRVLRNVNGKSEITVIEITAITKLGHKEKDMVLQPNDVVYVPHSMF